MRLSPFATGVGVGEIDTANFVERSFFYQVR